MALGRGLDKEASLELVRNIEGGSQEAWQRFVEEYAALIHAVVRRYLAFGGIDQRRDVFVQILERLHGGALYRYDGRSRLSTWLFIFSRSRCLDYLRALHGRRILPRWLDRLPAMDRRIFMLYYVEGRGCSMIRETLAHEGHSLTLDQLAESLERLDSRLDPRMRVRLANDLFAQSVGYTSGRLLDFLQRLRAEYEQQSALAGPEQEQILQELSQAVEQVRVFVDKLPELERDVIRKRYFDGRTARAASEELGLGSQRQVYTIESRALRRLRAMFRR